MKTLKTTENQQIKRVAGETLSLRRQVAEQLKPAEIFQPEPLKIGKVQVDFPVVLAPMAGVTDKPFRDIARKFGVELTFSEMVSSEALIRNNRKTRILFSTASEEYPLAVQIFGSKPDVMGAAAKMVENEGAAIVDINAGCPVKKIVRQGSGAALLKDLEKLANIIEKVKQAVKVPVTLKIRSGWDKKSINVIEISKLAENCGIDALIVHPRTATQLFSGEADWEIIRKVKETMSIPVIGNGDVKSPKDVNHMFTTTGCDGVMIGRASIGNPWIFAQTKAYFRNGSYENPTLEEIEDVGREHFEKILEFYGDSGLPYAKTVLIKYVKYLPCAREARHTIYSLHSRAEVKQFWGEYFERLRQKLYESDVEEEDIESNRG